nr:MAG TPA: hypothetical protein [Caudoviricetes sp.]
MDKNSGGVYSLQIAPLSVLLFCYESEVIHYDRQAAKVCG